MKSNAVTAILVNGNFFMKKYSEVYYRGINHTPLEVSRNFYIICHNHLGRYDYLHQILFYDCEPPEGNVGGTPVDLKADSGSTKQSDSRDELHAALKKCRQVTLKLSYYNDPKNRIIRPGETGNSPTHVRPLSSHKEEGMIQAIRERSISKKIERDIIFLAFKGLVKKIVLISSGDYGFVSAAKIAREKGVEFVLDSMWDPIDDTILEHIDSLRTTCPKPIKFDK